MGCIYSFLIFYLLSFFQLIAEHFKIFLLAFLEKFFISQEYSALVYYNLILSFKKYFFKCFLKSSFLLKNKAELELNINAVKALDYF